jgi:hypothetical protein
MAPSSGSSSTSPVIENLRPKPHFSSEIQGNPKKMKMREGKDFSYPLEKHSLNFFFQNKNLELHEFKKMVILSIFGENQWAQTTDL